MKVDREAFLVLAAALAACHQPPADAAKDGTPSDGAVAAASSNASATGRTAASSGDAAAGASAASSGAATAIATAAGEDICAELEKANDAVLAKPTGACPDHESEEAATRTAVEAQKTKIPFFHYCHKGKGTWAVMLTKAEIGDPVGEAGGCGWEVQYKVVYQPTETTTLHDSLLSTVQTWKAYPDETTVITKENVVDTATASTLGLSADDWQNGSGEEKSTPTFKSDGKTLSSTVNGKTVVSKFGSP